jgi:hypothetical protein
VWQKTTVWVAAIAIDMDKLSAPFPKRYASDGAFKKFEDVINKY